MNNIPNPIVAAELAPWRELYETDPAVTQDVIAARIGRSKGIVSDYIRRLGWVVLAHIRSARCGRSLAPRCIPPSCAAPSVWAWAQGVTVSTARHGGRHVKVVAGRPASSVWSLAEGGAA